MKAVDRIKEIVMLMLSVHILDLITMHTACITSQYSPHLKAASIQMAVDSAHSMVVQISKELYSVHYSALMK